MARDSKVDAPPQHNGKDATHLNRRRLLAKIGCGFLPMRMHTTTEFEATMLALGYDDSWSLSVPTHLTGTIGVGR